MAVFQIVMLSLILGVALVLFGGQIATSQDIHSARKDILAELRRLQRQRGWRD